MVDCVCDGQVSLVLEVEGGGGGSRGGRAQPLLNKLLVADFVDEALSITDDEGSHFEGRSDNKGEVYEEACSTAVLAQD